MNLPVQVWIGGRLLARGRARNASSEGLYIEYEGDQAGSVREGGFIEIDLVAPYRHLQHHKLGGLVCHSSLEGAGIMFEKRVNALKWH